jgi:hypothetical protein
MIIFSLLTTYMMGATIFCLVRSFQTKQTGGVYAQIIISLLSTYGAYVLSSESIILVQSCTSYYCAITEKHVLIQV